MKAKSIEELLVWQRARELVNNVYSLTKKQNFRRDFSLVDQIRRATISVMSNIAEGYERGSNTEFIQFLYIAKASCGEVRTQLLIALDQGYINKEELEKAKELALKVSGMLSNFIAYLKRSKLKGDKYKEA
ncbi:MAG: four helix bundle protein [candidate division Zixibacteria bacterium]|nr:four helix bundle protein [candidate division Zixibacteria bacterium]